MKKHYGEILRKVLGAAGIALAVMCLSGLASHSIAVTEEERCRAVLEGSAWAVNNEMDLRISDNLNILKLASAVTEQEREHSDDILISHIRSFQELTIFDRIDILYPDDTMLFQDGQLQDVSDILSFAEISAAGEHLSDCMDDLRGSGKRVIHCYVPVVRDGQTTAVVVGVLDRAVLSETIRTSAYDGAAMLCIADRSDGTLIVDEWDCNIESFFALSLPEDSVGSAVETLIDAAKNGRTGTVVFPSENGSAYVYYTPVACADWQLMIAVPDRIAYSGLISIRRILNTILLCEMIILCCYFAVTVIRASRLARQKAEAEERLLTANTLIECIRMLSEHSEAEDAINNLLRIVNTYFAGDRSYLFEIDYQTETTSNTYEYAAEGVSKEIDNLQMVPLEAIRSWMKKFRDMGSFCISDIDDDVEKDSDTYEILASQNIHRLIAVPLMKDDVIIGFFGVDNPTEHFRDFSLISSAAYFLMDNLEKRRRQSMLERMSYEDNLTKLFNRNKFNHIVADCEAKPPRQLGVAYFDLNGLKVTNDRHGHAAGDRLIRNAAKALRYVFGENAFRIGGDEFAVIVTDMLQEPFHHDIKKAARMMRENDVSVSIGASWHSADSDIHAQLHEADEKMYEDKKRFYENAGIDRRRGKR